MILQRPKVVVTGMGILAANGIGVPTFWDSLLEGRSGIGPITLFDAENHELRIAGEVKNFDLSEYVDGQFKAKRLGRHTQFAIVAAQMAIRDAGLSEDYLRNNQGVAINFGVSTSAIEIIEQCNEDVEKKGARKVNPFLLAASQPNDIVSVLGDALGISTRMTISTACSAGIDAIAYSAKQIQDGKADLIIVGGADAPINSLTMASFGAARMIPVGSGGGDVTSCPFDLNRKGGIPAEGAAVLVLESLTHALARGARPLAEILGHGYWSDEQRNVPMGGLPAAMEMAMSNAGVMVSDVEYISAHGPSDPVLDKTETQVIKKVFGKRAYQIPVSSIKGCTGNPLAAIGPMQLVACAKGMQTGMIPPVANYQTPDPECDLNYVVGQPCRVNVKCAMINSHGMGGSNNCLIVGEAPAA